MASRPMVDVIVVTWNTVDETVTNLRNLMDSDQGCDVRLFVRDNGSVDGTVEALRASVPEAAIDAGKENLGFAAGVNTALARTSAPWVMLLNSDAAPMPGAIGRLVHCLEQNPNAAAAAPLLLSENSRFEHSTHPFPSVRLAATIGFKWNRLDRAKADELMLEGAWMHDRPRAVDWAIGAALLIRRDALDAVGNLDERFFMYVEDLEWCWRARSLGWTIRFEPSAAVRHKGNASGSKLFGSKRTREHVHNSYRFFLREHGLLNATAWWALNVLTSIIRLAEAIGRRNRWRIRYWTEHLTSHALGPIKPKRSLQSTRGG